MAPLLSIPVIIGGMVFAFLGEWLLLDCIPPTKAEGDRERYLIAGDKEKADALKEEAGKGFRRRRKLARWLAMAVGLGVTWLGAVWGFGVPGWSR